MKNAEIKIYRSRSEEQHTKARESGTREALGSLLSGPVCFSKNELDEDEDFRRMFFKRLNDAFRTKTFYMKVVLKYHSNPFFKFVIIKE